MERHNPTSRVASVRPSNEYSPSTDVQPNPNGRLPYPPADTGTESLSVRLRPGESA